MNTILNNKILAAIISILFFTISVFFINNSSNFYGNFLQINQSSTDADVLIIGDYKVSAGDSGYVDVYAKITNTTKINAGGTDEKFEIMFSYNSTLLDVDFANSRIGNNVTATNKLDWTDNFVDDGGWGSGYVKFITQKNNVSGGSPVVSNQVYTIAQIKFNVKSGAVIGSTGAFIFDDTGFGTMKPLVNDHTRLNGSIEIQDTQAPTFTGTTSVTGSTATGVNAGEAKISWEILENSLPINYEIWGTTGSTLPVAMTNTGGVLFANFTGATTGTGTSKIIGGLDAGVFYQFWLQATDGSVQMNSTGVSVGGLQIPDGIAPTNAQIQLFFGVETGSISLNFSATDNLDPNPTFDIFYYTGAFTSTGLPATVLNNLTSPTTINNLLSGTNYFFMIRATDNAGNVGFSSLYQKKTKMADNIPPFVKASLPAGFFTGSFVTNLISNEAGYIYFTVDGLAPTTGSTGFYAASGVSSGAVSIFGVGVHKLQYFGVDLFGNRSMTKMENYKILNLVTTQIKNNSGAVVNAAVASGVRTTDQLVKSSSGVSVLIPKGTLFKNMNVFDGDDDFFEDLFVDTSDELKTNAIASFLKKMTGYANFAPKMKSILKLGKRDSKKMSDDDEIDIKGVVNVMMDADEYDVSERRAAVMKYDVKTRRWIYEKVGSEVSTRTMVGVEDATSVAAVTFETGNIANLMQQTGALTTDKFALLDVAGILNYPLILKPYATDFESDGAEFAFSAGVGIKKMVGGVGFTFDGILQPPKVISLPYRAKKAGIKFEKILDGGSPGNDLQLTQSAAVVIPVDSTNPYDVWYRSATGAWSVLQSGVQPMTGKITFSTDKIGTFGVVKKSLFGEKLKVNASQKGGFFTGTGFDLTLSAPGGATIYFSTGDRVTASSVVYSSPIVIGTGATHLSYFAQTGSEISKIYEKKFFVKSVGDVQTHADIKEMSGIEFSGERLKDIFIAEHDGVAWQIPKDILIKMKDGGVVSGIKTMIETGFLATTIGSYAHEIKMRMENQLGTGIRILRAVKPVMSGSVSTGMSSADVLNISGTISTTISVPLADVETRRAVIMKWDVETNRYIYKKAGSEVSENTLVDQDESSLVAMVFDPTELVDIENMTEGDFIAKPVQLPISGVIAYQIVHQNDGAEVIFSANTVVKNKSGKIYDGVMEPPKKVIFATGAALPAGINRNSIFSFGTPGKDLVLTQPVTVKIPVPAGTSYGAYKIKYRDAAGNWLEFNKDIAVQSGNIVFQTDHFTDYGVVEQTANVVSVKSDAMTLVWPQGGATYFETRYSTGAGFGTGNFASGAVAYSGSKLFTELTGLSAATDYYFMTYGSGVVSAGYSAVYTGKTAVLVSVVDINPPTFASGASVQILGAGTGNLVFGIPRLLSGLTVDSYYKVFIANSGAVIQSLIDTDNFLSTGSNAFVNINKYSTGSTYVDMEKNKIYWIAAKAVNNNGSGVVIYSGMTAIKAVSGDVFGNDVKRDYKCSGYGLGTGCDILALSRAVCDNKYTDTQSASLPPIVKTNLLTSYTNPTPVNEACPWGTNNLLPDGIVTTADALRVYYKGQDTLYDISMP